MLNLTNATFLRAIFGAAYPSAQVAAFSGDPGSQTPGAFTTELARKARLAPDANTYFCISTFRPAPDGRARRRKDLFQACHVIVLDDVGEKLSADKARDKLGAPSYRLQTSPGSEQWGYILAAPATDPGRVAALLDGLVKASMNPSGTDPGMKGVTRLVRLPVGRNMKAKHGPGGVACVLLEWAPERRFSLDELAASFGIDLDQPEAGARVIKPKAPGERDLVAEMLCELGLVKGSTGDGHTDITCPFVEEHTGGADTGTAYLSGGGFKCHHGHCEDRPTRDFLAKLDEMMRDAGHGAWRVREEFTDVHQPVLNALWRRVARDERPTRAEYDALAQVDEAAVERVLRPAPDFFGTNLAPIRAALERARLRDMRRYAAPRRRVSEVVPLPAGYRKPVSLEEGEAAMRAAMEAHKAATAADTRPAGTVPLQRRGERAW